MSSYKIHREPQPLPPVSDIEIHINERTLCAILYSLEEFHGPLDPDLKFFQKVWKEATGKEWEKEAS